jgi:hypothetical protein
MAGVVLADDRIGLLTIGSSQAQLYYFWRLPASKVIPEADTDRNGYHRSNWSEPMDVSVPAAAKLRRRPSRAFKTWRPDRRRLDLPRKFRCQQ